MGTLVELINGWVLPVVAGPFIGSFLGVVVRRVPAGRGIVAGRSACEACGHTLAPMEMIPIASFALQRGSCRHCQAPIAPMHLGIELAALVVPICAALITPGGPFLWAGCVLGWTLLALGWIDVDTFRLPNALTLPLILAGLAQAELLQPDALFDRALGAAIGYASLWALAYFYLYTRKREGLGLGDAKLFAAAGAWLGVWALPWVAVFGSLAALLGAGLLRLRGRRVDRGFKLPFGPFMAGAIFFTWLLVQYDPPQ